MILIPTSQWRIKHNKKTGRGIFAEKIIAPGTVIGDYLGKIIHPREDIEKNLGLYTMWHSAVATILADKNKVGIHFINHSCAPNLGMRLNQGHMLFFALRKIFTGEELTACYYYDADDCGEVSCAKHNCYCGSPVCRGTLHTPPRLLKKWLAWEKESIKTFINHLPAPYGAELKPLRKYPRVINDNAEENIFELFGSWQKKPLKYNDNKLPSLMELRKRIKQTGCRLNFIKLNLTVAGISGKLIISE